MKFFFKVIVLLLCLMFTAGCSTSNEIGEALRGKVYKDISDLPELKNYSVQGGDLLPAYEHFDNRYFVMHVSSGNKHIVLFEDVTHKDPADNAPIHEIIDAIAVEHLNEDETLAYSYCLENEIDNPFIVAVVKEAPEDAEFSSTVVNAWRIDYASMRLLPLSDTKSIKCRLAWPE